MNKIVVVHQQGHLVTKVAFQLQCNHHTKGKQLVSM